MLPPTGWFGEVHPVPPVGRVQPPPGAVRGFAYSSNELTRRRGVSPAAQELEEFQTESGTLKNQQVMMWFSGLRGAVAVSLALELKDALDHSESDNGDGLVGTCFIIVLITVFGLGCTTTKYYRS